MAGELNWAVITPSYNLDLERCKLLCRSMDAFLTGPWHHYIIVDPPDLPLFKPLAGPRRTIVDKASILPKGFRFGGKVPFLRLGRFWWSFRHGPVFGWQMQQIVKLLMAEHISEEAMLCCDSDTLFLRPFTISQLERDGRVRFNSGYHRQTLANKDVQGSIALLKLNAGQVSATWGSDPYVTWRRETVMDMLAHISSLHGKPWHEAIGHKLSFAEYHLYGIYVANVTPHNDSIYIDNSDYCLAIWGKSQANNTDIPAFLRNLPAPAVAACVQSLIGLPLDSIREELDLAIKNHA